MDLTSLSAAVSKISIVYFLFPMKNLFTQAKAQSGIKLSKHLISNNMVFKILKDNLK